MIRYVDVYKDRYQIAPTLIPYRQGLQPETHEVALGGMLLQKIDTDPSLDLSDNIRSGNTLSNNHLSDQYFQHQCSNPSFGLSWAKDTDKVQQEHQEKDLGSRFGADLPKVSDDFILFLQNLIAKLERSEQGGHCVIRISFI